MSEMTNIDDVPDVRGRVLHSLKGVRDKTAFKLYYLDEDGERTWVPMFGDSEIEVKERFRELTDGHFLIQDVLRA